MKASLDFTSVKSKPGNPPIHSDPGTSVAALWRTIFRVKLNAILRKINAEHPRRKKFLVDLSQAMFV